jgi:hypothetical protein
MHGLAVLTEYVPGWCETKRVAIRPVRELDLGYARLGLERVARTGGPEALFAGLSNPASR